MKLFFGPLFFTFIFITVSFSQNTQKPSLNLTSDTLEGTSTDTSIVYIIKKPPVTIREKIEIQRTKNKQYYYFSLSAQGFIYAEKIKAHSGHEEYVNAWEASSNTLPSYGFGAKLWKAPKKTVLGIFFSGARIMQAFNYIDTTKTEYKLSNTYNHSYYGIFLGRWLRKGEKISFIPNGGLSFDYFISTKGLTIHKSDAQDVARLNRILKFNKYSASFHAGFTVLLLLKNSFLEVEPYIIISPFSATAKQEFYSLSRGFIGIRLALTNKLF